LIGPIARPEEHRQKWKVKRRRKRRFEAVELREWS
jgi:hypothetical protein